MRRAAAPVSNETQVGARPGPGPRRSSIPRIRTSRWLVLACLLASPTLASAQIGLSVTADPPGPDAQNLNGEVVMITNRQTVPLDLSGWTLCDAVARCYEFVDETTVGPGGSLRVRTGVGRDTLLDVYMGRTRPIWDDWADIATLRDRQGVVRARCVWDRGRGIDCRTR